MSAGPNRQQRRSMERERARKRGGPSSGDKLRELYLRALGHHHARQFAQAAQLYERMLALQPDHPLALNNLGAALLEQGKLDEAAAHFERSLALVPQLTKDFPSIWRTLGAVSPALADAAGRAMSAWPERLPLQTLFGEGGVGAIANNVLIRRILQTMPVQDLALERLLTSLRAGLLRAAAADSGANDEILEIAASLAKQCFINEYVFEPLPDEGALAWKLRDELVHATNAKADVPARRLLAVAMYFPLHALPGIDSLAERSWPRPVAEVIDQQIREPAEEARLRDAIPRLTPIGNETSRRVRAQYEENPYPRWVVGGGRRQWATLDDMLHESFPNAFTPLNRAGPAEVLIAGCGTGSQVLDTAASIDNVRLTAVDLSLTSLAYAKRKIPVQYKVEYGQADILNLSSLGRTFDAIMASGVLHHMEDPLAAWRSLLPLMRQDGLMLIGLYSRLARAELNQARAHGARKGFQPSAEGIRACRAHLAAAFDGLMQIGDFYSVSGCRDLLFHVEEHQLSLPEIKDFLAANGLRFIGFLFDPPQRDAYAMFFRDAGWSITDLDRWHDFEQRNPRTFSAMYQFWVQKV